MYAMAGSSFKHQTIKSKTDQPFHASKKSEEIAAQEKQDSLQSTGKSKEPGRRVELSPAQKEELKKTVELIDQITQARRKAEEETERRM